MTPVNTNQSIDQKLQWELSRLHGDTVREGQAWEALEKFKAQFTEHGPSFGLIGVQILGDLYHSVSFSKEGNGIVAKYALRNNGDVEVMDKNSSFDAHPDVPEAAK